MRFYGIVRHSRSGSNWLGTLCESTGMMGKPFEYFNRFNRSLVRRTNQQAGRKLNWDRDFHDIIRSFVKMSKDFFCPIMPHFQVDRYYQAIKDNTDDQTYFWMQREDKKAQAVSFYIAKRTGQYKRRNARQLRPKGDIDYGRIADLRREAIEIDRQTELVFQKYGIIPFKLTYEKTQMDPLDTVRYMAHCLGLDEHHIKKVESRMRKQRTNLNAKIRNHMDEYGLWGD